MSDGWKSNREVADGDMRAAGDDGVGSEGAHGDPSAHPPLMGVASLPTQARHGRRSPQRCSTSSTTTTTTTTTCTTTTTTTGILRVVNKPRRSSGSSVEFRTPQDYMQVEPVSPQPSADRLSVTFAADEPSVCSDSSVRFNVMPMPHSLLDRHRPPPISVNGSDFSPMERVRFSGAGLEEGDPEEDEDYSVSMSAIIQRNESTRRSRRRSRRNSRRPSSPFSPDSESAAHNRRRSSVFTTSSADTAISMDGSGGGGAVGPAGSVTQEQILENLRVHKEVLSGAKLQPWGMRRKLRLVRQAKTYVKKHEGQLQERLAHSRTTRDVLARFNLWMLKRWQKGRREMANLLNYLIPWEFRIKEIESHFGSVVASYFTFLRWLCWVNFVIVVVIAAFIVVPEILTADKKSAGERKEMLPEERKTSKNLLTLWDFEGMLKYSPVFYGWYTDREGAKSGYRLPFSYFMTGLAVYVYSFVATLRKMAANSRMSKLSEKDDECVFTWKLFAGWDYMIGNAETALNRVASTVLGFKEALLEEAEKQREERNWKIVALRFLVNLTVLGLLVFSAWAVVVVVQRSTEKDAESTLWRRNETTVVVTVVNFLFPVLFELLGILERYHPRKTLRVQLARIMALNLLNLYTLIFSLFKKISNMSLELTELKLGLNRSLTDQAEPFVTLSSASGSIRPGCYQVAVGCGTRATALLLYALASTPGLPNLPPGFPNAPALLNTSSPLTTPSDVTAFMANYFHTTPLTSRMTAGTTSTMTPWTTDGTLAMSSLSSTSPSSTEFDINNSSRSNDTLDEGEHQPGAGEGLAQFLDEDYFRDQPQADAAYPRFSTDYSSGSTSDRTSTWTFSTFEDDSWSSTGVPASSSVRYEFSSSSAFDPTVDVTTAGTTTPTQGTTSSTSSPTTYPPSSPLDENWNWGATPTDALCFVTKCPDMNTKSTLPLDTTEMPEFDELAKRSSKFDLKTRRKLKRLCWETMFGQELNKMTVMDLVMTIASTLLVDFFRAVFVRVMNGCWCWDLEKRFPQYGDFKIAENILHLVNNQGMVWMGMFFSPGLPLINLVKLAVMMYLRSWAVLTCNVPHEVVFRASRSNNFYLALLLTMLFLCVLPVGYAVVALEPSWHCGPFSSYTRIYHILTRSIRHVVPESLHMALDYMASPGIVIPLLLLLSLVIYYLVSLTNSLREANNDLKIQLRRERTEERRKMFQMVDSGRSRGGGLVGGDPADKWRKLLPSLPSTGGATDSADASKAPAAGPDAKPDSAGRRKELLSRLLKNALRKSSATSDEESAAVQGAVVDGDATDAEQPDCLPDDERKEKVKKKLTAGLMRSRAKGQANGDSVHSALPAGQGGARGAGRSPLPGKRKESRPRPPSPSDSLNNREREDSLASAWSDNIPVIRISKTESAECVLDHLEHAEQAAHAAQEGATQVGSSDTIVAVEDLGRKRHEVRTEGYSMDAGDETEEPSELEDVRVESVGAAPKHQRGRQGQGQGQGQARPGHSAAAS